MRQRLNQRAKNQVDFYHNLITARFFEGMVGAILEISGYEVYPYGYETLLPALRRQFQKNRSVPASTEERLRSTPDLLVVDPSSASTQERIRLVEVKYRCWGSPCDVRLSAIKWYQQYWPDAILVVVIPEGAFFYAQAVAKLNAKKRVFDLTRQFRRLEAVFSKVNSHTLSVFAKEVKRFTRAR